MGALSCKRAQRVWTDSGQIPIYNEFNKSFKLHPNIREPAVLSLWIKGRRGDCSHTKRKVVNEFSKLLSPKQLYGCHPKVVKVVSFDNEKIVHKTTQI